MAQADPEAIRQAIEVLEAANLHISYSNPYLPVYSALGGALVGAIATFIPTQITDCLRKRREKRSTTLAVAAEVRALLQIIDERSYLQNVRDLVNDLESGRLASAIYRIEVPDDRFPVYRANLQRLGILDNDIQVRIIQFYQLAEALIQDIKPGGLLNQQPQGPGPFRETLRLAESMVTVGQQILQILEQRFSFN